MVSNQGNETVWLDANRFYDAERVYLERSFENNSKKPNPPTQVKQPAADTVSLPSALEQIKVLESNLSTLTEKVMVLLTQMNDVQAKLSVMDKFIQGYNANKNSEKTEDKSIKNGVADDDDLDLFGSDEEGEEEKKLKEERLKAYNEKKSKKPALVAKSSVVLDVKPWDDETDMTAMEVGVKKIQTDGLVWGASKLVPLAFGIKKLQIVAVVEDEKVSIDWLQETIQTELEDLVQSVDVAAFNKL